MPRVSPTLPALCLFLACSDPPADADTGTATTTGTTTTATPTTTDATTGPPAIPGCDTVVRGAEDGPDVLAEALAAATPGATICLSGTFTPTATLALAGVPDLTLRGVDTGDAIGAGATLDFQRAAGTPGLQFTGTNNLTLDNLTVENTTGDAIAIADADAVTVSRVRVRWDGANTGAELFGLRIDACTAVLVDACEATGARDAGIWLHASDGVIVQGSLATANVAGIELENCTHGDVVDNDVSGNVIGLFVLDLPNTANGGDILVRDNRSSANNIPNFADAAAVSASIPTGIGALVLATDRVELRGNTLTDNDTTGALVVSFAVVELLSGMSLDDPAYDGWPETIEIHDNTFAGNGQMPAEVFTTVFQQPTMPAITWDGATDEMKPADPTRALCIRTNGDADFLNLDALNLGAMKTTDLTPHDCDHPDVDPTPG